MGVFPTHLDGCGWQVWCGRGGYRACSSAEVAKFRTIAEDTLTKVQAGQQADAKTRIKDLETAWDDDEATLRPVDQDAWRVLDGPIDSVLQAVRASTPDPATETPTLTALMTELH